MHEIAFCAKVWIITAKFKSGSQLATLVLSDKSMSCYNAFVTQQISVLVDSITTPEIKGIMMSTQAAKDQYVKVGQIETRFWTLGDEGTPVIMLHGLGGSVEDWQPNINSLAQHHRVYAVDLAGFGRSEKPPVVFTFSYGAQFVNDFMEVQHIKRASLIGNSIGGAVILRFAIQFLDKVDKLVLVNSAGLGRELAFILRFVTLPLIGELLTRPSRKGMALSLKQSVCDSNLITEELVESSYNLAILPKAQKYFLSTLRGCADFRGQHTENILSIVNNLATITAPTLIIWGRQDRILPVAHAYVAKERIPNAELRILDPCGHLPQLECSEDFNALVLEFLDR